MRIFLIILLLLVSCTRAYRGERERSVRELKDIARSWEEAQWAAEGWPEDQFQRALAVDPKLKLMVPQFAKEKRITCDDYGPKSGCIVVIHGEVRTLRFAIAKFTSKRQAKKMAWAMKEWWFQDYVFDKVNKEPVLENFVKEVYGAKKVIKFPK
ncbi:MAG: hypothetical protein DRQ88_10385 [Epsilonproteobacteria bacterium]|nr:MAG: hypothetical protein DRQ88_10385 [Campylobacterota bacterium]RLA65381.1 MAG: hypothetical protein DRQ89_01285 [Campylobacterota bacterium]